jgi:quercetin dioxygenase-like cupin family protein
LFDSVNSSSIKLCSGAGEAHIYCIRFDPGGKIGEHPTGYGQFFFVVEGEGWVCGKDKIRKRLAAGQGAYFSRGELHSKGSESGMTAIMVQVHDLEPEA